MMSLNRYLKYSLFKLRTNRHKYTFKQALKLLFQLYEINIIVFPILNKHAVPFYSPQIFPTSTSRIILSISEENYLLMHIKRFPWVTHECLFCLWRTSMGHRCYWKWKWSLVFSAPRCLQVMTFCKELSLIFSYMPDVMYIYPMSCLIHHASAL